MLTACKNQGCVHAAPTLASLGRGPAGQTAVETVSAAAPKTALELIDTSGGNAEQSS